MKITKSKIQVLLVHGGMTFKNEKDYLPYLKTKKVSSKKKISWTGDYLEKSLGKKFEIISPRMPLQDFAKYRDWKIFFERYLSLIKNQYPSRNPRPFKGGEEWMPGAKQPDKVAKRRQRVS